ncbi:MAG: hypothetical protein ACI4TV_06465 [Paludibacteraceae bacterium]
MKKTLPYIILLALLLSTGDARAQYLTTTMPSSILEYSGMEEVNGTGWGTTAGAFSPQLSPVSSHDSKIVANGCKAGFARIAATPMLSADGTAETPYAAPPKMYTRGGGTPPGTINEDDKNPLPVGDAPVVLLLALAAWYMKTGKAYSENK